jgi:chorismate--pyruvate lyase
VLNTQKTKNTRKVFPYFMPVTWQSPCSVHDLSPKLSDWLLNTGSLTERLQALTPTFSVNLLGQQLDEMDVSEARLLASQKNDAWQVREVILQGMPRKSDYINSLSTNDNTSPQRQDWVFARSILPNSLCQSQWANLGNQPLGSRIFNDDNFVRSSFEIGKLHYHPLSHKNFGASEVCWARRSKFTIEKYELIVAEAFLPQSPCYW